MPRQDTATLPLYAYFKMGTSVLDDLGQEVTGIVAPVSICMFFTVLLVRLLNPEGFSNPNAVAMAQAFYKEQVRNSTGRLCLTYVQQLGSCHTSSEHIPSISGMLLQEGDSAGTKIEGALINALIFVIFVGALTFVLFLLFKYGVSCYGCPAQ